MLHPSLYIALQWCLDFGRLQLKRVWNEISGLVLRVPVNTPISWCSRMVITLKHDGSPRRVVDFQAVDSHCPRQTHHTKSPWQIASAVPPGCAKTVLDAWHGYHSVPIPPSDRHITMFLTKEGKFRYRTSPQGLLSAGDVYTTV